MQIFQRFAAHPIQRQLTRSLVIALTTAGLLLSPTGTIVAQTGLPNLGDDTQMSLGAERRFGDQIGREIYRDPDYVADPVLDAYITKLWLPLVNASKRRGELSPEMSQQFAWKLFLIRDKSINAFALPGGYFGVHMGLIGMVDSPDELASVLAHELTHVTQRHIARGMSKQSAQGPLMVAGILIGLLAMRTNPQAASAAIASSQAGAIQSQLNFSRDMEREADRIGFTLMEPAGYAPIGFVSMFNKLARASQLSDSGNFPYLRSHPLTSERIADMSNRVQGLQDKTPLSTNTLHRLMSARARVLADLSIDALKQHVARAQNVNNPAQAKPSQDVLLGTLYAGTLAAWQQKDLATAHSLYSQLLQATKGSLSPLESNQAIRWLGAEIQLPIALDMNSDARPEVFLALEQKLAAKPSADELSTMAGRLQNWLSLRSKDAEAWGLLSRVRLAQGQPVRALMAEAEQQSAWLDESAALARYQAAQDQIRRGAAFDTIDAAIIDSKVRELQTKIREKN